MGGSTWVAQHWLDLIQSVGIVGGLLFSAYTTWKDARARQVANSIAITEQYRQIWKELYERPELSRVMATNVDMDKQPISEQEGLFVKMILLHMSTVYRAIRHGEFVKLEGLRKDMQEFLSLPIPKAVWREIKRFQDSDFVAFLDRIAAP